MLQYHTYGTPYSRARAFWLVIIYSSNTYVQKLTYSEVYIIVYIIFPLPYDSLVAYDLV